MKSIRLDGRARWVALLLVAAPLLAGAECSRNTVAQSAATTAANVFITQLVTTFFQQLTADQP